MSRRSLLQPLKRTAPLVLPSLLLCDFGNLEREVTQLQAAGVRALHLDVMDGQFVPNLTYGMPIVKGLHDLTDIPLDVHLMIANPEKYIQAFFEAGAAVITIHAEATDRPRELLCEIRELGIDAGIAVNPATPINAIEDCVGHCDLVLVMSVDAGFGGQQFNPVALEKLRQAKQMFGEDVVFEVDGGINTATIGQCAEAGAEWFVAGSAIFGQQDYGEAVNELTDLATKEV